MEEGRVARVVQAMRGPPGVDTDQVRGLASTAEPVRLPESTRRFIGKQEASMTQLHNCREEWKCLLPGQACRTPPGALFTRRTGETACAGGSVGTYGRPLTSQDCSERLSYT